MIQISFKVFFGSNSVSVNNIDRQTVPQRRCSNADRSHGKFSARSRHDQVRRAVSRSVRDGMWSFSSELRYGGDDIQWALNARVATLCLMRLQIGSQCNNCSRGLALVLLLLCVTTRASMIWQRCSVPSDVDGPPYNSEQLAISNQTRLDFKYMWDFRFLKKCRIPSDSESVTSLV